ncbi:D-alanyl-D-alanine carboxypeptidase family protein [Tranquillimonas alkanivorans]|uniref:D-alanyl-D-alanine carboxypeptidase family protein n=1 Tax=Tranquillimonas alkanivorans TaxID=441119 RepID=UPI001FE1CDF9|nr:D-alanyl-D-alanine carboxypeptidase family protein [Tranquillimonas alkanivorans]
MIAVTAFLALSAAAAQAAPYAAHVIDARSGEVLHSENADARLHPASLTKMMTLYIAFQAVENGEIGLDDKVTISRHAASEPPSKLGLRTGQTIAFRYLIRAAAVKSANDAATAIGEAISGSEAAFARRMTRTAQVLGMTRTTFKNAHGLTESGHLSSARDMTTLGRHLFYDFPEYYNLFSRRSTYAGIRDVPNTNRRLLADYKGADGIKTGFTNAAGFNLVASAERGGERVIATVFGGRSTASRNAKVAELLDLGFRKAPTHVAVRKPVKPVYDPDHGIAGKVIRVVLAVNKSPRPRARPGQELEIPATLVAQIEEGIDGAVAEAGAGEGVEVARLDSTPLPRPRPEEMAEEVAREVVTRMSTAGGRHWGINVGRYGSRYQAERVLLKTALAELGTLDEALRKVVQRNGGFEANFVGMTEDSAALACRRLAARDISCETLGPG